MTVTTDRSPSGIQWLERPGPGQTLVFLHGIGSNAGSFLGLFEQLPETYRLLAWNAPGYGGSRRLDPDWPVAADYARALAGFLDEMGAHQVTLVGHSLGTLIAGAFAKVHPDRAYRMILAASACGYQIAPGDPLPASVGARITDLDQLGAEEFARTRAPRLVFEPERNRNAVAQVEHAMAQIDPAGYAQAVRMLASGDLPGTLNDVRVPCSFIIGTEDAVTPEAQTIAAARAVEGATGRPPQIERIARAGHAVYLQRPAAFADALMRLASPRPGKAIEPENTASIGGVHG